MYVASHLLSFHPYFFVFFLHITNPLKFKEIKFDPKPSYEPKLQTYLKMTQY